MATLAFGGEVVFGDVPDGVPDGEHAPELVAVDLSGPAVDRDT